jgi:hypothetical protein
METQLFIQIFLFMFLKFYRFQIDVILNYLFLRIVLALKIPPFSSLQK